MTNEPSRRKRGRPSFAELRARQGIPEPPQEARPAKRRRGRPSLVELRTRQESGLHEREIEVRPEEPQPANYSALVPRIRRISKETVSAKWTTLPETTQEQVMNLISSVGRPVVTRYDGKAILCYGKRFTGADQTAQKVIVQSAQNAFPAKYKGSALRLRKVTCYKLYKRDLEAQLTPAIHSNGQLLSEIEKEELMLEDDIERLEALEREVKAKEEKMQEKVKAIHPLLAFKDAPGKQIDAIELTDSEKLDTSLEGDLDDNLLALTRQLGSHLESMQSNTGHTHHVRDDLMLTLAAVDDALYRRLDPEQYAQVALAG
ncbi:MAG: hypothetical protein M1824_005257 [Vezdaea acicularis]|nr:MAG: hypothetical protein M1824_005257 [Vezdaea acicularis]